jgi:hypothetical protein
MTSVSIADHAPRELAPDIFWISGCAANVLDGVEVHVHQSTYLLRGERTLLIDTGLPSNWNYLIEQLDLLLGDRPLDYLFPTHPELPHSGNTDRILERYPHATLVGDMRDWHLFFPRRVGRMRHKLPGDVIDLGRGLTLTFVEAVIKDLPNTIWAYESSRRVIFVSDGFAYSHYPGDDDSEPYHLVGECWFTSSELPSLSLGQFTWQLRHALTWSKYTDGRANLQALEKLLRSDCPSDVLAPTHGNVIDDINAILPVMKDAYGVVIAGQS